MIVAYVLCLLPALSGGGAEATPPARNVLILVADDLGVDKLSFYGLGNPAGQPPTPNLAALAASGVRFRNAYGNPVCSPTRATLLTGRYSFRTGLGDIVRETGPVNGPLSAGEWLLPQVLASGSPAYVHACFGKWHLDRLATLGPCAPIARGWGDWAGTLYNLQTWPQYNAWPKWVFDSPSAACLPGLAPAHPPPGCPAVASPSYATTDTVDEALQWIASNGPPRGEPWVCYVAFHAPHEPFHRPPDGLYTPPIPPLANAFPISESPLPYLKATIEALDREIGRLLACMDPAVLAETVVIFLSDNGSQGRDRVDQVNYDLVLPPLNPSRCKGTVYEGGVRVPLLVSGPLVAQPGRVSDALVNTVDVFAAVAEIAGVDLTALGYGCGAGLRALDGQSFVPVLTNPTSPGPRTWAYSEIFVPNFDWTLSSAPVPQVESRALRNARFKLVQHRQTTLKPLGWGGMQVPCKQSFCQEFYDLWTDPWEQQDLLKVNPASWPPQGAANYLALRQQILALLSSCP